MSRLKTDAIRNVNASVDGINLDTSGNVGLGTTSPNTKLHVEGTGTIAEFKSTNNNYLLQLKGNNSANYVYLGTTSSNDYLIANNTNGSGFAERLRITSDGRIGVGTSPHSSYRFDIRHTSNAYLHLGQGDATLGAMANNTWNALSFQGTNAELGLFKDSSGNYSYIMGTYQGGTAIPVVFRTGNRVERLRITSDGTSLFTGKITNSSSFTSHNTNFYGGNVNTGGVRIEVAHSTTSVSGNTASASFPHHLLLSNYSGNGSADNRMCSIGFDIPTTSTHANAVIAYQATAAGTGDLQFHLESGNSISEKLRITSAGKLQIGTAGGNATYLALAGNAAMDLWGDGSEYPTLRLGTEVYNSVGEDIRFGRSDHGAADIRYHSLKSLHGSSAANNYLEFFLHDFGSSPYTSQKSAFKINGLGNAIIPDGDLVIGTSGHGIDFSATGGGSGTSNESELLADYENGEWTPVLHHYISGGFSAPSYSAAGTVVGRYTKIGNIVHISASFLGFNISNAHGSSFARITGLPFTSINHPNNRDVISTCSDAFTTNGVNFSTYWNQTNLNSMKNGTGVFDWGVLSGGSAKNIVISGHYYVA